MPKTADNKDSSNADGGRLVKAILEEIDVRLADSKGKMAGDDTFKGRYWALSELKLFIKGYQSHGRNGTE